MMLAKTREANGPNAVLEMVPRGLPAALSSVGSADLWRGVFERARHGILLLDADTLEVVAVNPFFCSLVQCDRQQILAKTVSELPLFRELEVARQIGGLMQDHSVVQCDDLLVTTPGGQVLVVEISFQCYSTSRKLIECNVIDVTNRKRREIARRRIHTMDALRRVSTRVGEELGHLLPGVAAVEPGRGESLRRSSEGLRAVKTRMQALVRELSAFGGAPLVRSEAVNLNLVVTSLEGEIRAQLGNARRLEISPVSNAALVQADEWQLRKVIRKLVANACAAIPEGGVLTIETGCAETAPETAGELNTGAGGWGYLAVTDSGKSLDDQTWSRLFEPFQVAGGLDEGGFGLASVYGMVKQSGGHITVSSTPQVGTTFRIYLPQARAEAKEPSAGSQTRVEHKTNTIFLLEHDEGLRNVTRNLLQRKGYSVVEARSEAEAWEFLRSAEAMSLIVADVSSVGSGGGALAMQIAERYPANKTIFTVDQAGEFATAAAFIPADAAVLVKPFRLEALLAKIKEVLGD